MSRQEADVSNEVFYLSSTRKKIGENFSFYNDNFYTDIDALDRPSNSDMNTIKVDIPRVCLVTGKNEVTAQKISFINKWMDTNIGIYNQGDIDAAGSMPGIILSAYKTQKGMENLHDFKVTPPKLDEVKTTFICEDVAYAISIQYDQNNPDIWIVGISSDFDKKTGVSDIYISPKLNNIIRASENDEYSYYKDAAGLKSYGEHFQVAQNFKEKISQFLSKIPDNDISKKISNIFSDEMSIDTTKMTTLQYSINSKYPPIGQQLFSLISSLKNGNEQEQEVYKKTVFFLDKVEKKTSEYLRELPSHRTDSALSKINDFREKIFKATESYIKNNNESAGRKQFDKSIKEASNSFISDSGLDKDKSKLGAIGRGLAAAIVNLCAAFTFGIAHCINKKLTGHFGFYTTTKTERKTEILTKEILGDHKNFRNLIKAG